MAAPAPPPPGFVLQLAPGVLVRQGGRLLVGGSPLRLIRLSTSGAAVLARWAAGEPLGDAAPERALARRLLDAGVLTPQPIPTLDLSEVAVVVPVHDAPTALARCLATVRATAIPGALLVADDGSPDGAAIAAVASRHGAALVRAPARGGAAAARNLGMAATSQPIVAFVDADVVVEPGCLQRLVAHLDDPAVGAAAPRVLGLREHGLIGRYEARHSSLDMGPVPGLAAPGGRIPYVPSATLVVRRDAVPPGGLDEGMPIGEDVDLVWRMAAAGHRIVYDPVASVRHDHRTRPSAFARRRWTYARSIGPLARRHRGALPALRADPLTAATLAALAARRPVAVAGLLALRLLRTRRAIAGTTPHATRLAARLTAYGTGMALRSAGHAVRRAWSPALVLTGRAGMRLLAAAYLIRMLEPDGPRGAGELALAAIDDAIASLGTWAACAEHRTAEPLMVRWPT